MTIVKIDHVLVAFMTAVGLAVGIVITLRPELRNLPVPPYFWVLITMALFEGANFMWRGIRPHALPSMGARLIAFIGAILLITVIPLLAGGQLAN